MRHLAANILMAAMLAVMLPAPARAHEPDEIDSLNKQVVQLYDQGKYAEATAIAQQALTLAERVLGKEHPNTLKSVANLAALYQDQGRYGEAEPLYGAPWRPMSACSARSIPIRSKASPIWRRCISDQGRYGEAEPLYKRAVGARSGCWARSILQRSRSVNSLAGLYRARAAMARRSRSSSAPLKPESACWAARTRTRS